MPREGAEILPIADVGDVEEVEDGSDIEVQQRREINNVTIIAVPYLDTYKACIRCKARVEPLSPPLGRCSKSECDQCSANFMERIKKS